MRTSYLTLIAAAAMIMAACSNESVLREIRDNGQPTAITFSSYSEKSTKADNGDDTNILNLEYFHKSFAVYGTKQSINDATEISYVFGDDASTAAGTKKGTACTYTANNDASFYGSNWSYEEPRFWESQANYQFVAYAPALVSNPLRYEYAAAGNLVGAAGNDFIATDYVLTGKNLQSSGPQSAPINKGFNVNNQDLDLMTSAVETQAGSNHNQVQFTFRHILSKINIIIGKTAAFNNATITIDSIKITGLHDKGSYQESRYDISTPVDVSGWIVAATNNDPDYTLFYKVTDQVHPALPDASTSPAKVNPLCFIESLVIPQTIPDGAKITLKYNIVTNGRTEYFTYEAALKDIFTSFFDRKSYSISFTIDPSVITFDAGVSAWADQNIASTIIPQ